MKMVLLHHPDPHLPIRVHLDCVPVAIPPVKEACDNPSVLIDHNAAAIRPVFIINLPLVGELWFVFDFFPLHVPPIQSSTVFFGPATEKQSIMVHSSIDVLELIRIESAFLGLIPKVVKDLFAELIVGKHLGWCVQVSH